MSLNAAQRRSLTAVDGAALSYRVVGPPDGPAIVLLHSLALDGSWFAPLVDRLASDFRLVVPDFRGHGANVRDVPGLVTLELLAADVFAVMRDAGIERASVVGISLGGMVAQACAAIDSSTVERAVLIATAGAYDDTAIAATRARADAARAGLAPMAEAIIARWFGAPQDRDADSMGMADRARTQFLQHDPQVHARFLEAMTAVGEFTVPASTPTLVIAGRDDLSTPLATLESLAAGIPAAELIVTPGGHLVAFTHPDEIAAHVTGFITQTNASHAH